MRRLLCTAMTAGLVLAAGPLAQATYAAPTAPAAAQTPSAGTADGTYAPVEPARLYDSRTTGAKLPLRSGQEVTVPVAGRAGVPAGGVRAAVVNLTVTKPTTGGYLAAYPSSSTGAGVSSLNFARSETRAALATVPVGPDGAIKVRLGLGSGGTGSVVVDVQGYYLSDSSLPTSPTADYFPVPPTRVVDTRLPDANGEVFGPLEPNDIVLVDVGLDADQDTSAEDVDALAVNLTAVGPTAPGYLVAYDGAADTPPATSNVNFAKGGVTPNNVVVPVQALSDDAGSYLEFGIGNGSAGRTHVVADVVGVYAHDSAGGLRFEPLEAPVRITDSRVARGLDGPLGTNATGTVTAPSTVATAGGADTPGATRALVGTITAVKASASTFLTAWAFGEDQPVASNLNPAAGQTVANHLVVGLSDDARFNVFNRAGSTDVLVDVTGRFTVPTPVATATTSGQGTSAQQRRAAVTDLDLRPARLERASWRR